MPKLLDEAQVAAYRRDGFVTPMRAVSAEQAESWRARMADSIAGFERAFPSDPTRRQPPPRLKPYLLFRWAAEIVRHPAILDAVEDVIGPDILVFHTTLWWKKAGTEGFVPWHQDGTYFGLAPHEHVTAWVALTPSTLESGCVTMLPGSHREGQIAHVDAPDPAIMLSRGQTVKVAVDESQGVPVQLQPGEFSLHDTMVLHASAPNRAAHDRIGLGISYIPARCYHTGPTRLSATLVRGANSHNHFDLEAEPKADMDAGALATHADSLERFRKASETIPEMSLVH
ncbi:phytanoyl-CoA dioxygenase family protein [Rhodovarius crocodyli]|nr:phytanoyl-CoA dioxygenase family protein [Rhodovarius crocodyli]